MRTCTGCDRHMGLNSGQWVRLILPAAVEGWKLGEYFTRYGDSLRPCNWRELLEKGAVTLDGVPASGETPLNGGQRLSFFRPPWREPDVPSIKILYRDQDLVAIDKPPGVPVTPSGVFLEHCVLRQLKRELGLDEVAPIHRLDMETSGVLLFSAHQAVRGWFQRQFAQRTVVKHYRALVHGEVDVQRQVLDFPIGPAQGHVIRSKQMPRADGKRAVTHILDRTAMAPFSLLLLKPLTGRTNQIRAQLAAIGHPIVGDKKYHRNSDVYLNWVEHRHFESLKDQLLIAYHALHAQSVAVGLPSGTSCHIESKMDAVRQWRRTLNPYIHGQKADKRGG